MEHLTIEQLARLIDEPPEPQERRHLDACRICAAELEALRDQTEALAALPEILPPKGDWRELEARLRSEGLIETPGLFQRLGLARTPSWMPAAAAVVLFLGGAGAGWGAARVDMNETAVARATTVEEAAEAVRSAEQDYVTAVAHMRDLMGREGLDEPQADPLSRYAALETVVSVSQAAVRQAPGDPYLNGLLTSALAERDAAAKAVAVRTAADNWF